MMDNAFTAGIYRKQMILSTEMFSYCIIHFGGSGGKAEYDDHITKGVSIWLT